MPIYRDEIKGQGCQFFMRIKLSELRMGGLMVDDRYTYPTVCMKKDDANKNPPC